MPETRRTAPWGERDKSPPGPRHYTSGKKLGRRKLWGRRKTAQENEVGTRRRDNPKPEQGRGRPHNEHRQTHDTNTHKGRNEREKATKGNERKARTHTHTHTHPNQPTREGQATHPRPAHPPRPRYVWRERREGGGDLPPPPQENTVKIEMWTRSTRSVARRREGERVLHSMRLSASPLSQRVQGQTPWAACYPTRLKNLRWGNCRPQTLCHDRIIWYEGRDS